MRHLNKKIHSLGIEAVKDLIIRKKSMFREPESELKVFDLIMEDKSKGSMCAVKVFTKRPKELYPNFKVFGINIELIQRLNHNLMMNEKLNNKSVYLFFIDTYEGKVYGQYFEKIINTKKQYGKKTFPLAVKRPTFNGIYITKDFLKEFGSIDKKILDKLQIASFNNKHSKNQLSIIN